MSKLTKATGTVFVLCRSALVSWFRREQQRSEAPARRGLKRPRVPKAVLDAAYEEAADDPAYMREVRETTRARDCTAADGLQPVVRSA